MTIIFIFSTRKLVVKTKGFVEEIIPSYSLTDFKKYFRVSRNVFEILLQEIAVMDEFQPPDVPHGGRPQITVKKQLLVILWYLGQPESLKAIMERFDLQGSSILRCRTNVYNAVLTHLMPRFLCWPDSAEQKNIVKNFEQQCSLQNMIGVIGESHMKIKTPSKDKEPAEYVNAKGYHSVVLQAVAREDLRFIHASCGWPGKVLDNRVIRNSELWTEGVHLCGGNHIIGDSAYPLRRWLLTPYRETGLLVEHQTNFNIRLSSALYLVENAVAQVKGRFRRLLFLDIREIDTITKTVIVGCVLHNLCLAANDQFEQYMELSPDDDIQPDCNSCFIDNDAEGSLRREKTARNVP